MKTAPRAVGLKRSIHTRSCCKRKRKRDRPENILGASKAELISPKALGKTRLVATIGRGSQLLASPNSRDGPRLQPKLLRTGRYMPRLFTTILCKSIQYYGFTLLTMTNLTQHHKTQLQHMTCPEIDDERPRGAPNYMTTFFTTH